MDHASEVEVHDLILNKLYNTSINFLYARSCSVSLLIVVCDDDNAIVIHSPWGLQYMMGK